MIGLIAATFSLVGRVESLTGRYDMGERLKALDAVWMTTPSRERRVIAVMSISEAVNAFFTGNYPEACRSLDGARDALLDHLPAGGDAVTLRFDPPFAEPKAAAQLHVSWAYVPRLLGPVRIAVGSQVVYAAPGRDLTIQVHPESVVTELAQSPEAGVLVPVTVGQESRTVYLNVVKGLRNRARALLNSKQIEARTLAENVIATADGALSETDMPLIQMLFTAELLDTGGTSLDRLDEIPLVKQGPTVFRVAFPASTKRKMGVPVTVVIGLHGAGGSENMFFEAYGRGKAVSMATERGWVFASPRASARAVSDVLEWIRTRRKLKIGRVLILGHSMGGALAVSSAGSISPRPAGIALFSPAIGGIPKGLSSTPIFLTAGKQDIPMVSGLFTTLKNQLAGRRDCVVEESDPCEHLMSVAEGLPGAYKFFDGLPSP
jgi:predicted esterase